MISIPVEALLIAAVVILLLLEVFLSTLILLWHKRELANMRGQLETYDTIVRRERDASYCHVTRVADGREVAVRLTLSVRGMSLRYVLFGDSIETLISELRCEAARTDLPPYRTLPADT